MKRLFSFVAMFLLSCFLLSSSKTAQAQGPCFARGGEVNMGGTVYFVCPAGGLYTPCAYPCRQE